MTDEKSFHITGGRVIDPARGLDKPGDILISEGTIARQGLTPAPDAVTIDARGLIVCPGFIDLHAHLRQPGFPEKETIKSGSRAAAGGGFTTVCAMPNTEPPLDSPEIIKYVNKIADAEAAVRVLPIGCITQGRKGQALADLAALAEAGCVGFSDDGSPVADAELMRRALEFGRETNLPIIEHSEDTALSRDGVMNDGPLARKLGLKGIPHAAEEAAIARDIKLASETGGWLHVAHVSTAGSVALIREAKARGIRVTAEVTPHHLTLTEAVVTRMNTDAKVNPPLRSEVDVRALLVGLLEGVIDIIATDHAPHSPADKAQDFIHAPFGISGLETALGSLMSLVHSGRLSLPTLITKLTSAPAGIIGGRYGKLGTLEPGAAADVVIFDPEHKWVVEPDKFYSKGHNTPLKGTRLKGRVLATISWGRLVYRHSSLRTREREQVKG